MKVLLSIKPEFASKIFDGSKKYEYRRNIFKRTEVTTIVVYASEPIKKVMGEFEIGEILQDEPQVLWLKTGEYAGITKKKFLGYFKGKAKGYAIKVKEARVYDMPMPLGKLMVSWPPQSFLYLWPIHGSLRGACAPLSYSSPSPYQGEGDKGLPACLR